MKGCLSILFVILLPLLSFAQGKLMLVGGGAEDKGGWSDIPYQWAIDNSTNKRVAVISYSDEDNFIPDYLVSLGADQADNIKIDSRALADEQSTYDKLMQYDVFFFKGGDQSNYYTYFKDTKTAQATRDKFNAGGVIAGTSAGMAILSDVVFTAQGGAVYPDECLQDYKQSSITLVNDFLSLFPDFIFDTHFTERGRGARLLAFMAKWFSTTGEMITGVGVDDRTALCIATDKKGTVYGTGSVSVYSSESFSSYQDDKLVADSVHVTQLLHGHSIDLDKLTVVNGPENILVPNVFEETGNYQLLLSGSEVLSTNLNLINYFVANTGTLTDTVVVITSPGKAKNYIQKLQSLDVNVVLVETSTSYNDVTQLDLRNTIRRSKKIMFAENDDNTLFDFLNNDPTGKLITEHIRRNGIITSFIGEDSRYAGKTFVTNHLGYQYAAYYGELTRKKGLGLLRSSTIMSNTYDANSSEFYENTTAAIPYVMVSDSVKYGIYLNRNSYLKFYQQAGHNYFNVKGNLSGMVLINKGTKTAFESQPVNGAGATRNYVGFADMQYTLLNGDAKLDAGITKSSIDKPYEFEVQVVGLKNDFSDSNISVFPNPSANGIFHISLNIPTSDNLIFNVYDCLGRTMLREQHHLQQDEIINLSSLPNGVYVLNLVSKNKQKTFKLVKQ